MTDKIVVGKFGKTFGVRGWIKLHSFTNPPENIINFAPLFVATNEHSDWQEISDYKWKQQGNNLIILLQNVTSPEQAKSYTNQLIGVNRTQLPEPENNEFYWNDLVGCQVVNTQEIELGFVNYLFTAGSNDVMVVKNQQQKPPREHFIPFLKDIIINVDLTAKKIIVDWDPDF